ncbi:MAG: chemotaxis protein CheW [Pirellula sp.]|nr:chemotaxis protein CheW [Pirellula sp.]
MSNHDGATTSLILFELAATTYAVPSRLVQQMEMVERITPVPNAPAFVDGVVFARGQVVPALNLRLRFGFERVPYNLKTRLVVLAEHGRTVGLIVDSAREFLTIPTAAIQPPPETVTGLSGKYLAGIAYVDERLLLILDVSEILNFTELATA